MSKRIALNTLDTVLHCGCRIPILAKYSLGARVEHLVGRADDGATMEERNFAAGHENLSPTPFLHTLDGQRTGRDN